MFRKVRIRLTAVCTLVTVTVMSGMLWFALRFPQQELARQGEESFASGLSMVFNYLQGQSTIEHAWLSRAEVSSGLIIHIEDAGQPLLYGFRDPERETLARAAQDAARRLYGFESGGGRAGSLVPDQVTLDLRYEGIRYRAAVCAVPSPGGWLSVTVLKSRGEEQVQMARLRGIFLLSILLAALCLLVFSWFFTGWATRPIEASRRRQNEFVSAASHELRSPLAVMLASAGAMQTAPLEQARVFARNIEGECRRLSGLARDLLTLAGADSRHWSVELSTVEPETLLLSVAERYEPLAHEKGLRLQARLPEGDLPRCSWDPQRIEQVLAILLDNAVSYTPQGGCITVEAQAGRKSIRFAVSDTGPGIPDRQKQKIFRRFYRGDGSRSSGEHYGLGLSIAWEIAALHRGNLSVQDAPGGGARFLLTLPVNR